MNPLQSDSKTENKYPVSFLYSRSRFAMGREIIYDYYLCDDTEAARLFLEMAGIPEGFHYMVVITPGMVLGRDNAGIYQVVGEC